MAPHRKPLHAAVLRTPRGSAAHPGHDGGKGLVSRGACNPPRDRRSSVGHGEGAVPEPVRIRLGAFQNTQYPRLLTWSSVLSSGASSGPGAVYDGPRNAGLNVGKTLPRGLSGVSSPVRYFARRSREPRDARPCQTDGSADARGRCRRNAACTGTAQIQPPKYAGSPVIGGVRVLDDWRNLGILSPDWWLRVAPAGLLRPFG